MKVWFGETLILASPWLRRRETLSYTHGVSCSSFRSPRVRRAPSLRRREWCLLPRKAQGQPGSRALRLPGAGLTVGLHLVFGKDEGSELRGALVQETADPVVCQEQRTKRAQRRELGFVFWGFSFGRKYVCILFSSKNFTKATFILWTPLLWVKSHSCSLEQRRGQHVHHGAGWVACSGFQPLVAWPGGGG